MNVSILFLALLYYCSFGKCKDDQGFALACVREWRDVLARHGVCCGVVHARQMQRQIHMMLDERDPG